MNLQLTRGTILGIALLIVVLLRVISSFLPDEWPSLIGDGVTNWLAVFLAAIAGLVFLKGWLDLRGQPSPGAQFAYKTLVGVLFFSAFLLYFFGERWLENPLGTKAYDIRTGEPEYMVYEHDGVVKRGFEGRELLRPSDCRPKVENVTGRDGKLIREMVPVPHQGFDYTENGTCVSPVDNTVKMRPVTPEDVPEGTVRSAASQLWSLVWGSSGESHAKAKDPLCTQTTFDLNGYKSGSDKELCIIPGVPYTLYTEHGMDVKLKLRFDHVPVRVRRQYDTFPESVYELIDVARYGHSTDERIQVYATNIVRLRGEPDAFKKYHLDGVPVYIEVYFE